MDIHDFKDAMEKGLGRAYLYVKEHGDEEVSDIILDHCLHNYSYDRQLETSRAPWLLSLIDLTSHPALYYSKIINAWDMAKDENFYQYTKLCTLLAKRGIAAAKEAIYQRPELQEVHACYVDYAIIDIDKLEGLKYVAQKRGKLLRNIETCYELYEMSDTFLPGDHQIVYVGKNDNGQLTYKVYSIQDSQEVTDTLDIFLDKDETLTIELLHKYTSEILEQISKKGHALCENASDGYTVMYACDKIGEESVFRFLNEHAKTNVDIALYLQNALKIKKYRDKSIAERNKKNKGPKKKITLEKILQNIENEKKEFYGKWNVHLSQRELNILFDRLLKEHREPQLKLFLTLFLRVPFPKIDNQLFELAMSGNIDIKRMATLGLANNQGSAIREFAISQLTQQTTFNMYILELFKNNYEQGDHQYLRYAIERISDDTEQWMIGYNVNNPKKPISFNESREWIIHTYSFDIINIYEKYSYNELIPVILWVYENTPCTHCRDKIVVHLTEQNQLPENIKIESQYNAPAWSLDD